MLRERFRIPFQSGFRWWELIAKRVDIALFMVVAQMTHLAAFQDERAAIKENTASHAIGRALAALSNREKKQAEHSCQHKERPASCDFRGAPAVVHLHLRHRACHARALPSLR